MTEKPLKLVDRATFAACFGPAWILCEGATNQCVRIIAKDPDDCSITFDMLSKISTMFGSRNINLHSTYRGPLSDVTPGMGADVVITVQSFYEEGGEPWTE